MNANILIVDDDLAVCSSITLLLKRAGFHCNSVNHPRDIESQIAAQQPDLILLDMNFTIDTSGKKGLATLRQVREQYPRIPVILMTGWATVQLAVEGMKIGAQDFLAKPWDNKQLLASVKTILALHQNDAKSTNRNDTDNLNNFENLIGEDPKFKAILQVAQRVSKTNASVLIIGESGTGKELIAEAIHYESQRTDRPFVKVNLGGISASLFESEMFGHKKGAFTDAVADRQGRFEIADTGTIFLDEIGDLESSSQVKLLRVLQEQTFEVLGSSKSKKVDIRVISATNKDLEKMVSDGSFREDLYYRINLIKITIPPLRERRSDIPLLVNFFLNNLKLSYELPNLTISTQAMTWLSQQHFPGNIRQLQNLVERTVLMATNSQLELKDFQEHYRDRQLATQEVKLPNVGSISLEELEVKMIKKALSFHHNKISQVAKSLGITRSALYRRLQKYNIPYDDQN
ncbi:MAG: sigma-54-dependent transcriptional regulator [Saprospiraceae bacterium]